MDFNSVLEAIPAILDKIDGPIGVISLMVILLSFITVALFSREGPWFKTFSVVLLFAGCGGVTYALLQPIETEPDDGFGAALTAEPHSIPKSETATLPVEGATCPGGPYSEFDTACVYFTPPHMAVVQASSDGTYFGVVALGPPEINGYVTMDCPDQRPPPGVLPCLLVDIPSQGETKPSYVIQTGIRIVGFDDENVPAANHSTEITFPGCDLGITADLGPLHVQSDGSRYATSIELFPQGYTTSFEETIRNCGTAGEFNVRYFTQAGNWKRVSLSRADFYFGLKELHSIYSDF